MQPASQIQNETTRLRSVKDQLQRNLHNFKDLNDDVTKATIFSLLNNFIETLTFLKEEIEFEYGVSLKHSLQHATPEVLEAAVEYYELEDFLTNFKKNLIDKQLSIKESSKSTFEALKRSKYHISTADELADLPESSISQKQTAAFENMTRDAKVMSTTKKITSKLVQSSQILETSLMQSQLNLDELQMQDEDLERLTEKHVIVGSLLEKSDAFAKEIKLAGQRDKRMMLYAIGFFFVCVLWVLWCRLLKWPVKITFGLFYYILLKPVLSIFGIAGKSKAVDHVGDLTSHAEMYATTGDELSTEASGDVESLVSEFSSVGSSVEEIAKTVSEHTGIETTDEFEEALGRIIDEL